MLSVREKLNLIHRAKADVERRNLHQTEFSSFHMVHMIEIVRQGKVDFPQVIVSGL